jgi:hypothetical protein
MVNTVVSARRNERHDDGSRPSGAALKRRSGAQGRLQSWGVPCADADVIALGVVMLDRTSHRM